MNLDEPTGERFPNDRRRSVRSTGAFRRAIVNGLLTIIGVYVMLQALLFSLSAFG